MSREKAQSLPEKPLRMTSTAIAGVIASEFLEEDGLAPVKRYNPEFTWPFAQSCHKGWNRTVEQHNPRFISTPKADCCSHPTVIHQLFEEARVMVQDGLYTEAVAKYELLLQNEGYTPEDHMFRAFACTDLGILYSSHPQNDFQDPHRLSLCKSPRKAALLFKLGALSYNLPFCKYYYGQALVYGLGGVTRDVSKGMRFLSEAAEEAKFGEAYLELGAIYERGIATGVARVDKDLYLARDCYRACVQVYNFKDVAPGFWKPSVASVKSTLLHTEGILPISPSIQGFGWSVAAQVLLLVAAAAMSTEVQARHFMMLLLWLPLLGLLLSFVGLLRALDGSFDTQLRGDPIETMLTSKLEAYEVILENIQMSPEIGPSEHMALSREFKRFRRYKRSVSYRMRLTKAMGWLAVLVTLAFLGAWISLLANEAALLSNDCGDWWSTSCSFF